MTSNRWIDDNPLAISRSHMIFDVIDKPFISLPPKLERISIITKIIKKNKIEFTTSTISFSYDSPKRAEPFSQVLPV